MPLPHNQVLFISYSHAWDTWSLQLYRAIFDTKLYFPFRDDRIPKTADWWQSLCLNIETSVAVIAMLTPEYLASDFCMGELDYALALKKPVVPILVNLEAKDYPQPLAQRNLQFIQADSAWSEQAMREAVLAAMNQVLRDYASGRYPSVDADFLPRPDAARPPVPDPKGKAASAQDQQLQQKIQPVAHVPRPAQDLTALIKQFYQSKQSDPFAAGNLLTQISQRGNLPFYFNLDDERAELQAELDRVKLRLQKEAERARQQREYDELQIVVEHQKPEKARRIVSEWLVQNADFGDPQNYLARLRVPIAEILNDGLFTWIEIPGKTGKNWKGAPYAIAKYPLTNAQFVPFIQAGGYRERQWWTDAGWAQREEESWTEPRFWTDSKWNGAEQPVVGVSWYEAVAFCRWLSDASGEKIMLPTEEQWQYAAQGDDGREYPWGSQWDCQKCNNSVKPCKCDRTTPVRQFEGKGDSFFGVVDMAGNVWEWCLTDYENKTNDFNSTANNRVVHGGSWNVINADNFRCGNRFGNYPHNWDAIPGVSAFPALSILFTGFLNSVFWIFLIFYSFREAVENF